MSWTPQIFYYWVWTVASHISIGIDERLHPEKFGFDSEIKWVSYLSFSALNSTIMLLSVTNVSSKNYRLIWIILAKVTDVVAKQLVVYIFFFSPRCFPRNVIDLRYNCSASKAQMFLHRYWTQRFTIWTG